MNFDSLNSRFILINSLIQRKYSVEPKSRSKDRVMNYKKDQESLEINYKERFAIQNKNIIIIDDITTTGCILVACRNLLLSAGAKRVVLLALGKTKEQDFYG